jgi:hypothetical protein
MMVMVMVGLPGGNRKRKRNRSAPSTKGFRDLKQQFAGACKSTSRLMRHCTAIGETLCKEVGPTPQKKKKKKTNNFEPEKNDLDEQIELTVSKLSQLYQQRSQRDTRKTSEALAFVFMPHNPELGKNQGFVHCDAGGGSGSKLVNELEMLCHAGNGTTNSVAGAKTANINKKRKIKLEYLQFAPIDA